MINYTSQSLGRWSGLYRSAGVSYRVVQANMTVDRRWRLMWFLIGCVKHRVHEADLGTANPQCFAKAGKMEPNHLLNGFGPLQPAVAMLWWLPELLLSAHYCTSRQRQPILGEWLECARTFDTCCSNLCPIKLVTHLTTLVRSPFLSECCLCASEWIDILETLSAAVSKIAEGEGMVAGGRHAACAISETQHSHIYERMRGCLAKSRLPPAVSGQ